MAARLAEGRKHWAFQPVQKTCAAEGQKREVGQESPSTASSWRSWKRRQFSRAARPSKLTLLRRVTFDLTGLPPTPEGDRRVSGGQLPGRLREGRGPAARLAAIRRALGPPLAGCRALCRLDRAWTKTTCIRMPGAIATMSIEAFNEDMPLRPIRHGANRRRSAAADTPGSSERARHCRDRILALGPKPLAQQDRVQMIYDVVDEQIDTATKAFLGLTVACARCHDHKFDPILTKDYYALAGIFASTEIYRNLGKPGAGRISMTRRSTRRPLDVTRRVVGAMYGKQLEMEEALAEDWTREYALLRPKDC